MAEARTPGLDELTLEAPGAIRRTAGPPPAPTTDQHSGAATIGIGKGCGRTSDGVHASGALWGFSLKSLSSYGFFSMAHEARTDFAMLLGSLFLLSVGSGPWALDRRLAHGLAR
jgi:hypothetical protein